MNQLGVPLEWVPAPYRAVLDEAAVTFRARFQLPDDAPLRVILPDKLIPEDGEPAEAILLLDGSFVTSDKGYLDLGIDRL